MIEFEHVKVPKSQLGDHHVGDTVSANGYVLEVRNVLSTSYVLKVIERVKTPVPAFQGTSEILRERIRQVVECGYDAGHDSQHENRELLVFAADILLCHLPHGAETIYQEKPEWVDGKAEEYSSYLDALAVAGALLAAEIDRLHHKSE